MLRPASFLAAALTTAVLAAACSDTATPPDDKGGGSSGSSGSSGNGGTMGGTGPAGSGGGNVGGSGGSTGGATTGGTGGTTGGAGGAGGTTGGAGGAGGSTGGAGGSVGGAGGSTGGAGGSTGGAGGAGGSVSGAGGTGGSTGGAAGMGGSGPDVDQNGKMNAAPGSMTSTAQDYLRLGEVRILNNNWGSEELGCNTPMSVFVNQDRTFGWNFNRGNCDTQNLSQSPDFPQIEFGIHPFGIGDSRVTSPEFSSTTLLPIQIKNVTSMSVAIQNLNATFQQEGSWNITFEFWISERDPLQPNPGVYAELMTFWGWQNGRWPAEPNGMGPIGPAANNTVSSGGKTYKVWVHDDAWADGQWRYYQFRDEGGPSKSFNGTLDVKPFIDYLVQQRGYSQEFWISRLEVGSEIDDLTQGTVQMSGITFNVNGESRSAIIGG